MSGWVRGFHGEPPIDPPDTDDVEVECPDCEGSGRDTVTRGTDPHGNPMVDEIDCAECEGAGERYLTDDEIRDAAMDAAEDAAERRADRDY